jgi:two-component system sensor histidine kinase SenX3
VNTAVLVTAAAAAAGLLGLVLGLLVGRHTARVRSAAAAGGEAWVESEDVLALLGDLSSHAMVLDGTLDVVRMTPGMRSLELVADRRIISAELQRAAARALRGRGAQQLDLARPTQRRGDAGLQLRARVVRVGQEHVLVLVEDQTREMRLEQVRRDFVANVSHELKTPIGAIGLLSEALTDAADDPEAVRRFAARMHGESTRLTRLVQEIIDLSRLQYDEPVLSAEEITLGEVVQEAFERARTDADARAIRLLAGGDLGCVVEGDRGQILTALTNLIENAVVYSPENTRVAVGVRRRSSMAEITVTDQGFGIPPAEQERIFERFYRVDQARSRETGGTGLGLSIVKHIAAGHGGDVKVWSVEGAGSTFTLRLPLPAHAESSEGPRSDRSPSDHLEARP